MTVSQIFELRTCINAEYMLTTILEVLNLIEPTDCLSCLACSTIFVRDKKTNEILGTIKVNRSTMYIQRN